MLPRERLFRVLDDAANRSLVWISGPPGSGKTTLAADWCTRKRRPGLWFQVDPGDNDPSTLFHYLAEAALLLVAPAKVPRFGPEHHGDIHGFGRLFFRSLLSHLPPGAAVVFDNHQELESGSPFHAVLADAVNEVPAGIVIVVLSRESPPPVFARAQGRGQLAFLDWQDLRLTETESREIATAALGSREALVARACGACGGWVAGLTLLVEGFRRGASADGGEPASMPEALFHYFASELFGVLDPIEQKILLKLALPEKLTASAARCAGHGSAGPDLLERLYRRRLFVVRKERAQGSAVFEFHALLREFLLREGRDRLVQVERLELARCMADALVADGLQDEPISLLVACEDWSELRRRIPAAAHVLFGQGRHRLVASWAETMPPAERKAEPRILYCWARSILVSEPERARGLFCDALALFESLADAAAQVLCVSGIVESYFLAWNEDASLLPWIARLEELLESDPPFESVDEAVHVHASLVMCARAIPGHPAIPRSADAIAALIPRVADPNVAGDAAAAVFTWFHFVPDVVRFRTLRGLTERHVPESLLAPASLANFLSRLSFALTRCGEFKLAADAALRARDIASAHGVRSTAGIAQMFLACALFGLKRRSDLAEAIAQFGALVDPSRPFEWNALCGLRAVEADQLGRFAEAEAHLREAVAAADQAKFVWTRARHRVGLAVVLTKLGRFEDAERVLDNAREIAVSGALEHVELEVCFAGAWIARSRGAGDAYLDQLSTAIGRAASAPWTSDYLDWVGVGPMAAMLADALEEGIQSEFLERTIRSREIDAPSHAAASWPWRVRITVMGKFELHVDGNPWRPGRKPPRLVLSLLGLVLAAGPAGVAKAEVCDLLWPDRDGDAADDALVAASHRLRRILGYPAVLSQSGDRVRLSTQDCWVDAWYLLQAPDLPPCSNAQAELRRLTELYRGPFLLDDDSPGTARMRERIRTKVSRWATHLASAVETSGDGELAAGLVATLLDNDPGLRVRPPSRG